MPNDMARLEARLMRAVMALADARAATNEEAASGEEEAPVPVTTVEPKHTTIALGDRVRDTMTGFAGICTNLLLHINGCVHVYITPEKLKDGKLELPERFDIQSIEVIDKGAFKPARKLALEVDIGAVERPGSNLQIDNPWPTIIIDEHDANRRTGH